MGELEERSALTREILTLERELAKAKAAHHRDIEQVQEICAILLKRNHKEIHKWLENGANGDWI